MATHTDDRLTAAERHELPDSAFGIPETREFPLVDAEHVRAAEAYFRYAPEAKKAALARRILAKAANSACTYKALPSSAGLKNPDPHGRSSSGLPRQTPATPQPHRNDMEAAAGIPLPPLHATILPARTPGCIFPAQASSGTFRPAAQAPVRGRRRARGCPRHPCAVILRRSKSPVRPCSAHRATRTNRRRACRRR